MTAINSIATTNLKAVSFKGNEQKPKNNPGAAVASLLLPGAGQLMKGETANGLTRLGITGGLLGASIPLSLNIDKTAMKNIPEAAEAFSKKGFGACMKAMYKGVPKVKLALSTVVLPAAALIHTISAAVDAYKPKKSDA